MKQQGGHACLKRQKGKAYASGDGHYSPFAHEHEKCDVDGEEDSKESEGVLRVDVRGDAGEPAMRRPVESGQQQESQENPPAPEMKTQEETGRDCRQWNIWKKLLPRGCKGGETREAYGRGRQNGNGDD